MATSNNFSTGANTARFLEKEDVNALSAIAGKVNCTMFILADMFAKVNEGKTVLDANKNCGVDVVEPTIEPAPIQIAGPSCQKIKEEICKPMCMSLFLNNPTWLPGEGSNLQPRHALCINMCIADHGC